MRPATRIDWAAARRRMAQVDQALAGVNEIDAMTLQRVWQRRAEQLARSPETEDDGESIELVLVRVGGERYGLPVHYVIDIQALERITHVPHAPCWVAGVTHWRGRILTVVDVRQYFGLPEHAASTTLDYAYRVVVQSPSMQIGLRVDDVLSISRLRVSERQLPDVDDDLPGRYIVGLAHSADLEYSKIPIVDLQRMLADPRLIVREELA
jgi:purine-binding chemotaxis protein CheW